MTGFVGVGAVGVLLRQAVDLVATRALGAERVFAAQRCLVGGFRCRRQLVRHPRREVVGRETDRVHAHSGVAETAELGALTGVDARVIGLHSQGMDTTRARRRACR